MHFSDCQFEITASFITFHNPERFESIFCHGSTTPICLQDRNHNWMIAILHKFFYVSNLILFFLHSNFFIDSHMAFCKFFQSSVINIFDHSFQNIIDSFCNPTAFQILPNIFLDFLMPTEHLFPFIREFKTFGQISFFYTTFKESAYCWMFYATFCSNCTNCPSSLFQLFQFCQILNL